jgi:hexosaminidase
MNSLSILPHPVKTRRLEGCYLPHKEITVGAASELQQEAELLAERLRRGTGYPVRVVSLEEAIGQSGGAITLSIRDTREAKENESYCLTVSEIGIAVKGSDAAGVFYGTQTLLQLLPPAIFSVGPRVGITWELPCCEIEDFPRFKWRGMMLDSARHWQPVAFIKRWIDLLAQHKFNVFHWHLTDHQGWRMEIEKYPRLTEVGAWRGGTAQGHYFAHAADDGVPYGGFYSKQELRDIVMYAASSRRSRCRAMRKQSLRPIPSWDCPKSRWK